MNKHEYSSDSRRVRGELREKYGERLNSIPEMQKILRQMLEENNGYIIGNAAYNIVSERCQDEILRLEHSGVDITEIRKEQNKIETMVDNLNKSNPSPTHRLDDFDFVRRPFMLIKSKASLENPKAYLEKFN